MNEMIFTPRGSQGWVEVRGELEEGDTVRRSISTSLEI